MKKLVTVFVVLLFWMTLIINNGIAQETKPEDYFYYVITDVVKPSMISEYEAGLKKIIRTFKDHKLDIPFMQVSMTEDLLYYQLIPLEDLQGIYKLEETIGKLIDKVGNKKWQEITKDSYPTVVYDKLAVIVEKVNLGYEGGLKPEEIKYIRWADYYIHPGKN
ncbi:hypothetical protein BVY01_00630, partial [bacterium I07]